MKKIQKVHYDPYNYAQNSRGIDTGDLSLVVEILNVCGPAHVRSHVSPGMDWTLPHKHDEQGIFKRAFTSVELTHRGATTKGVAGTATT